MKFKDQLKGYPSLELAEMSEALKQLGYEDVEVRAVSTDLRLNADYKRHVIDVKQGDDYFRVLVLEFEASMFMPKKFKISDIKAGNFLDK